MKIPLDAPSRTKEMGPAKVILSEDEAVVCGWIGLEWNRGSVLKPTLYAVTEDIGHKRITDTAVLLIWWRTFVLHSLRVGPRH